MRRQKARRKTSSNPLGSALSCKGIVLYFLVITVVQGITPRRPLRATRNGRHAALEPWRALIASNNVGAAAESSFLQEQAGREGGDGRHGVFAAFLQINQHPQQHMTPDGVPYYYANGPQQPIGAGYQQMSPQQRAMQQQQEEMMKKGRNIGIAAGAGSGAIHGGHGGVALGDPTLTVVGGLVGALWGGMAGHQRMAMGSGQQQANNPVYGSDTSSRNSVFWWVFGGIVGAVVLVIFGALMCAMFSGATKDDEDL